MAIRDDKPASRPPPLVRAAHLEIYDGKYWLWLEFEFEFHPLNSILCKYSYSCHAILHIVKKINNVQKLHSFQLYIPAKFDF